MFKALCLVATLSFVAATKPNILMIVADDLGWYYKGSLATLLCLIGMISVTPMVTRLKHPGSMS